MRIGAAALVRKSKGNVTANSFGVGVVPHFGGHHGILCKIFRFVLLKSAEKIGIFFAIFIFLLSKRSESHELNRIRRPIPDVKAATICFPTRNSSGKALVRVHDPAVMLVFEFVLDCVGSGVSTLPESFDEIVALFVVAQCLESAAFWVVDYVSRVLVEP